MSRKAVLITLRKQPHLELNLNNFNDKFFLLGLNFLKAFKQLLFKKGCLLVNESFNVCFNQISFIAKIYFTTKLLKIYKRKSIIRTTKYNLKSKNIFEMSLSNLTHHITNTFKTNSFKVNLTILNKRLNKKWAIVLFKQFRPFVFVLFNRRFNLYVDFIKLTCLYFSSLLTIDTYLYYIATVFKYLQKKSHGKFVGFLNQVFCVLIFPVKKLSIKTEVLGMKLIINGRFKGKTRSKSTKIQIGKIPTQALSKKIEYAKTHIFTKKFGVFGFKLWVYKK